MPPTMAPLSASVHGARVGATLGSVSAACVPVFESASIPTPGSVAPKPFRLVSQEQNQALTPLNFKL